MKKLFVMAALTGALALTGCGTQSSDGQPDGYQPVTAPQTAKPQASSLGFQGGLWDSSIRVAYKCAGPDMVYTNMFSVQVFVVAGHKDCGTGNALEQTVSSTNAGSLEFPARETREIDRTVLFNCAGSDLVYVNRGGGNSQFSDLFVVPNHPSCR